MKFKYIKKKLIELRSEVEIDNEQGHFDINKIVEDVYMHILNDIYGWNLKNANLISENFPAIDLIDETKMIVIQVTSTTDTKKLRSTISKFKSLDDKYKHYDLKMFYIKDKPNFAKTSLEEFEKEGVTESNLLGINDILDEVSANVDMGDKLYKTLHKIFEDKSKKDTKDLTPLPPINPNFIGREADLKTIKENLSSDNVLCVVNGIGGVGKSELSYKYLHEHKEEYNKIAFVEMTEESASLEEVFRIKFQDALYLTAEDSFDTIIKRLQSLPKKNLLLLDNLLNNNDFKKIKPLNINFDILVTTRAKLDSNNILNLETLNDEDAEKLFRSIYSTSENIEDVLKYLDNHPLFINLTAYSLKEEYIELEELKENIKSGKVSDIDSKDEKTFKEHLQDTFNKQFEDEENEDLKTLLQVLALFPATEISFEMLSQMLDDKKLKVKLQKLVSRGWLSKKENSYKLHQIIKTFMLEEHAIVYEEVTYVLENIAVYIDPDDSALITNQLSAYIPIVDSLLGLFEEKEDTYIADILEVNVYLYSLEEKPEKALPLYQKIVRIREELLGENHLATRLSYKRLGLIYELTKRYQEAKFSYEKALRGEDLVDKLKLLREEEYLERVTRSWEKINRNININNYKISKARKRALFKFIERWSHPKNSKGLKKILDYVIEAKAILYN